MDIEFPVQIRQSDKCGSVKNTWSSGLLYTRRVKKLEKIHEKRSDFFSSDVLIYIDNRNVRRIYFYKDNIHLLQSGKKVWFDNFISDLNSLFLMYSHPSPTVT